MTWGENKGKNDHNSLRDKNKSSSKSPAAFENRNLRLLKIFQVGRFLFFPTKFQIRFFKKEYPQYVQSTLENPTRKIYFVDISSMNSIHIYFF